MSGWRREAIRLYPEARHHLTGAVSLADFLFTLLTDVRDSYVHGVDPGGRSRAYEFIKWCMTPSFNHSHHLVVVNAFLVHLGAIPHARNDLPTLLPAGAFFGEYDPMFASALEVADYDATVAVMVAARLPGDARHRDA